MANHSFIPHKGSYLRIHEDYLKLMGGNFCEAAVLDVIEYWTGIEWANANKSGEFRLPWVEAPLPKIHTEMYGMYSLRSIQEALKRVESAGFITVDRSHGGSSNKYLLNVGSLTWALTHSGPQEVGEDLGWKDLFEPKANGKIAVSGESEAGPDGNSDGKTDSRNFRHYKETHSDSDNTVEETPIIPFSDLDLDDEVQTFVPNACRRAGRPRLKLGRKSDQPLVRRLEESEQKYGRSFWRACLLRFYATDDHWLRENGWPLNRFLQNPETYAPEMPLASGADDAGATQAPSVVAQDHPPSADAPQRAETRIDYPAKWNELVPASPVDWDASRGAGAALRACIADEVFCARFEEMCGIVQKIHEIKGVEADWLTFEFAIRSNGKGVGWWRILTEFRSMAITKPDSKRRGSSRQDQIAAAGERLLKKLRGEK